MKKAHKSKKVLYFQYRDAGLDRDSPEIKKLSLTYRTRANYEYQYRKAHGLVGEELGATEVLTPISGVVPSVDPEKRADMPEDGRLIEEPDEPGDQDPESDDPGADPGTDTERRAEKTGPKKERQLPGVVVGEGLTFAVTISVKTLMFYQYACSQSSEPLSFGDFVDACVEDVYTGRGFDLGLVRVGGNGHATKEGIPDDVRR